MNSGKCPQCKALLSNVKAEDIGINVGLSPKWQGLSYLCPFCSTILGVGINPLLVGEQIADDVAKKIRAR